MSDSIECPHCGRRFTPGDGPETTRKVHPTVVRWLTEELTWSGEEPTERMYASYLYSFGEEPVSRRRFVEDLAYLGVPETINQQGVAVLTRK